MAPRNTFGILRFCDGAKRIVIFGAANSGLAMLDMLVSEGVPRRSIAFYDNNPKKWGTRFAGIPVLSSDVFGKLPKSTPVFIASSGGAEAIASQLGKFGFINFYHSRALLFAGRSALKYDAQFRAILEKTRARCGLSNEEQFTLYASMQSVQRLSGEVAELGVYKGGSALLLSELKGKKSLHLFDTFEGLPHEFLRPGSVVPSHMSDTSYESVRALLKPYRGVYVHKGTFPETARAIPRRTRFSFVHLDADLYESTIEGLKFFWPKLTRGGRLVSHDYNSNDWPGVKRAFQEFFKENPEKIIQIADTQVMVIK